MSYQQEYERWLTFAIDAEIKAELTSMTPAEVEDAFYRDLAFGTGGLRGILGAGTNRMNIYTVGKATQGLAYYLLKTALPSTSPESSSDPSPDSCTLPPEERRFQQDSRSCFCCKRHRRLALSKSDANTLPQLCGACPLVQCRHHDHGFPQPRPL